MPKKKICFVVAVPETAQSFLLDHIEYLKQEYEVHLVANFSGADNIKEFADRGIFCHDVHIQRSISIYSDCTSLLALAKVFRREKFSCVHSVTPKAGLLCAMAGWLARIPNRVHIFTGQVWATRTGAMRTLLKGMDKLISVLNTRLLVDGESQRQFLIKEGILSETNSMVPANGSIAGVKLERFVISETVRQLERSKFGFSKEDVVYIFMGRLNHDKGIGELYEAFDHLVVECKNAKLLLYGSDEEGYEAKVAEYKNLVRNKNFFYPGSTRTPYNALQSGDVFVLPTWREGFGVSVLEAQALSLPVITSDAYGVVDASVDGETGLRCHVNDPKGLCECMKTYYNNAEMRIDHGRSGRRRVEEKFNNSVVSQAWLDIYKEIL